MSNIECSECHDIVDVTARTIELPYVCEQCVTDFYQKMSGKTPAPKPEPCQDDCCAGKAALNQTFPPAGRPVYSPVVTSCEVPVQEQDSVACDSATIENTTTLIADLEQQLAESKQQIASLLDELDAQKKLVTLLVRVVYDGTETYRKDVRLG